jgi:hypothetical protein
MNSKFVNFAVKSVSAVATSLVLLVSNPMSSFADSVKKVQPNDAQLSVIYTGSNSKTVVFHLSYENVKGEKFELVIKNEAGDVVYEDTFSDVHFDRNIFIDVTENKINPTFILRTDDQELVRSVSVNKKAVVSEPAVTKL